MRRRGQHDEGGRFAGAGRLALAISRHPRQFVATVMGCAAVCAIFTNALYLQKGPHPAPIFATRPLMQLAVLPPPRPAAAQPAIAPEAVVQNRPQLVVDIQRELGRRGYYDGAADGIWGARTDAAARDFAQAAGVKVNPEASGGFLQAVVTSRAKAPSSRNAAPEAARNDPIAELIAPSKRILAIQRALADFGYGQITLSGVYDPETRDAIEKFERDRRLPVTGQISDRFVRDMAAMTGRPLE